jgi:pimeloyl-ACP methyl ester carboxylesterase
LGVSHQFRVESDPYAASLSVWVINPDNSSEIRGTILVLHGLLDSKQNMVPLAHALAAERYRAVLVDLRAHGRSSGQWVSFGVFDGRDLVRVLDALADRRLLAGEVGVLGPSYGGAAGLQLAALDKRVKAVVTMATFTTIRDVVPRYVRKFAPLGMGWFISEETIQQAIGEAGDQAGFEPDRADSKRAVKKTEAAILFIHGGKDSHIPRRHSQALYDASDKDKCRLIIYEKANHFTLFTGKHGEQAINQTTEWFDCWLK